MHFFWSHGRTMLLYKILFGEMAIVNTETNFSSLSYAISGGKFGRSRVRALLSAVIPKLLSVLGNIDTTSQETSREPTRGGSFAFKACILLIKSVKSSMNDGRFWESSLKSRELFNSCTTTKCDETEWIVSLVCKLRGNP